MTLEFNIYGLRYKDDTENFSLALIEHNQVLWESMGFQKSDSFVNQLGTVYRVWGKEEYATPEDFLKRMPVLQKIPRDIAKQKRRYDREDIQLFVPENDLTHLIRDAKPEQL